jgi:hypothetical protein
MLLWIVPVRASQQRRHHLGQRDVSHIRRAPLVRQPSPGERLAPVVAEPGNVNSGDFLLFYQLFEYFCYLRLELTDP